MIPGILDGILPGILHGGLQIHPILGRISKESQTEKNLQRISKESAMNPQ